MKKPLILVTNDDGITAPGLRTLIHVMNKIGEVVVVAPDSPQSGMGHAITISDTLYSKREKIDDGPQTEYSISGTPADCVKFEVKLKHVEPLSSLIFRTLILLRLIHLK